MVSWRTTFDEQQGNASKFVEAPSQCIRNGIDALAFDRRDPDVGQDGEAGARVDLVRNVLHSCADFFELSCQELVR